MRALLLGALIVTGCGTSVVTVKMDAGVDAGSMGGGGGATGGGGGAAGGGATGGGATGGGGGATGGGGGGGATGGGGGATGGGGGTTGGGGGATGGGGGATGGGGGAMGGGGGATGGGGGATGGGGGATGGGGGATGGGGGSSLNDTCATAIDATALGTFTGTTAAPATDDYGPSLGMGCAAGGAASGRDVVYSLSPVLTTNYTVTVTPMNSSYDPMLYAQATCGSDMCLGATIFNGPGQPETITFGVPGGTTAYIIVDGENASTGPFTLTVQ
ncbi:MAG: hypothetical protein QM817_29565 [Archangium sp.]